MPAPISPDPIDATANLGTGGSGYTPPVSSARATRSESTPKPATDKPGPTAEDTFPQGDARYEEGDELGRGGWGSVRRARDRQLDRDVAVKRINAELASASSIHERFLHEARITGQLQHPGIVPVHELGRGEDGAPFYVMKLLEGATFRDSIREVHADSAGPAGGFSVELLNRFSDVCNAVAYSHQRGIIHRDLKPSNIMVGRFGETIVVDWGLAKQVVLTADSPSRIAAEDPGQAGTRSSVTTRAEQEPAPSTQRGAILGTPAYMSPEQAQGEAGSLHPATDIYALGVILYEVLTGKNPFRSDDVETTLTRVRAGEYRAPQAVNRRVPRRLAAICRTAMAREPGERYERAEQIVNDLQRFLAGEAVSVYRDPWWARVLRWCRRRPALTAGVLGSGVVLTIASVVFGALVSRAHQAELRARIAAEESKRQALERLSEARQAGDAWLIDLSGSLQFFPGMEGLRSQLLEDATSHYERLAAGLDPSDDQDLTTLLERAKCSVRLGDLNRLLERLEEAQAHYTTAVRTLDSGLLATDEERDRWQLRAELVNARLGLRLLGDKVSAEADADWLIQQLADSSLSQEDHHTAINTFARLALATARSEQNSTRLVSAEKLVQQLAEERGEPRDHQLLQTVRDDLAACLLMDGRVSEAAELWREEVTRLEQLIESRPGRPDLLQSLAFARMQLGGLHTRQRQERDASVAYTGAIKDLESAWRLADADAYYRRNVAVSQTNLSHTLRDEAAAEQRLHEAIEHLRQAVAVGGPSAEDLERLAECYESLGTLATRRGDPDARSRYDSAEQCYAILRDHEQLTGVRLAKRARSLAGRVELQLELGDQAAADQGLLEAIESLEELKASNDPTPAWAHRLAVHLEFLRSQWLSVEGEEHRAAELRTAALDRLRGLADKEHAAAGDAFPAAMLALVDRLLETPEADATRTHEAGEWLAAMRTARPGCVKTADWQQRRALVAWLSGDDALAAEAIAHALEERPNDRVSRVLAWAVGNRDQAEPAIPPEIASLRDEAPGDQRLRRWHSRLTRPQS